MHASRRPLIAGNWKMNHGGASACGLAAEVKDLAAKLDRVDLVVAPPFTALAAVAHELDGAPVGVAAQNLHAKDSGAFTGEVSGPMLLESGAGWVILGHSERRQLFGETDAGVAEKVRAAMAAGLRPIACVGETLEERDAGRTFEVVVRQLLAFAGAIAGRPGYAVVAYEPVWAIGTGRNATPGQAQEVHAEIRRQLDGVAAGLGANTRILYGGSVKADNARALLGEPDVDGALVGGASLDAKAFGGIAQAAQALAGEMR